MTNLWNSSAPKKILIRNGLVVNADSFYKKDVYIKGSTISALCDKIKPKNKKKLTVLDAHDMYVLPGGIDPNTNFDYKFENMCTVDDFYYGTRAAVAGGTTMIVDCVSPVCGESLEHAFQQIKNKADRNVVCDYALRMSIPAWSREIEREMGKITMTKGVNTFKMNMADKETMLNDIELYHLLNKCKKIGALAQLHAENGSLIDMNVKNLLSRGVQGPEGHYLSRPEELEVEAVNRACTIAHQVECPLYICNVMSARAAKVIAENQQLGYKIYGETIGAALGCTGKGVGCSFKTLAGHITNPPISHDETNPTKMMEYVSKEVLLTTASNNRTFYCDQKAKGVGNFSKIPDGVNGVEDRMSVVWQKGVITGLLTLSQFVAVTSTNSAKMFNFFPQKGIIKEGSDADIVIWNPRRTRVLSHNNQQLADFNIFAGMEIKGAPEYVIVRGRICAANNEIYVQRGFGNYIFGQCFSPRIYSQEDEVVKYESSSESEISE